MFTLRGALSQLYTHRAARTGFCVRSNAGNYRLLVRVNDVAEQRQRSVSGRKYSNSFKTNYKPSVKSANDLAKSSQKTNAKFELSAEDEKILNDVFRDRFSRDRCIQSEEWTEIKNSVIGLPFAPGRLVSNINVNNVILKYCGTMDRIIIIKSFSQYLEKLGNQSLYIFPLLQAIVNTDNIKGEDDFVSEVSNTILEVGFENSISDHYWTALRALIKTQYWRKGLELARTTGWEGYNDNRHDSHQPSVQTFTDLAVKALEQGEEELMWDIMKEPLFHGNDMPLRYPEAGGHKTREILYNKWIEHCSSLENPQLGLEKLFNYFQQFDVHPTPSTCRKLQEVYSSLPDSRLSNTQLDHYKGSCFCCDTVLDPSSVTADELKHLNQSILHHLLKRKDIYQSTSPQELSRFQQMLKEKGRFDIVMDGLNVALTRIPGSTNFKPIRLSSSNLFETVKLFHEQGKKILVLHRAEILKYPHYSQLKKIAHIHILDRVTTDDPYFIIASLHSGSSCQFVTSDLLRQHLVQLYKVDPALAILFNRWQISHQIYVSGFAPDKPGSYEGAPRLYPPPLHAVTPFKTGEFWHIPLLREDIQKGRPEDKTVYFGVTAPWLCIGPNLEKTESGSDLQVFQRRTRHFTGDLRRRKTRTNEGWKEAEAVKTREGEIKNTEYETIDDKVELNQRIEDFSHKGKKLVESNIRRKNKETRESYSENKNTDGIVKTETNAPDVQNLIKTLKKYKQKGKNDK